MEASQQDEGLAVPEGMVLEIQGRRFRPSAETSFEQDIYIMSHVKESGLMKMAAGMKLEAETALDISQEIIVRAFASGRLFFLLAGAMEEDGVPWSVGEANKNAHFFAQLRVEAEKKKLHGSIVGILMGFFVSAGLLSTTSPKYSVVPMSSPEDHESSSERGPLHESSVAPTTTGSGTESSER